MVSSYSATVHLSSRSSRELLQAIGNGDREALAELYHRYADALYHLALRILRDAFQAEDAVHDVYLSLWRKAKLYASEAGEPLPWLMARCRNRCIDMLRATQRKQRGLQQVTERWQHFAQPVLEEEWRLALYMRDGHGPRLCSVLDLLPAHQWQAIELAYFLGYSHSDIARALDLPPGHGENADTDGRTETATSDQRYSSLITEKPPPNTLFSLFPRIVS